LSNNQLTYTCHTRSLLACQRVFRAADALAAVVQHSLLLLLFLLLLLLLLRVL
jgi:hypothetical protein